MKIQKKGGKSEIIMNKRIKVINLKAGLLLSLFIACPLNSFAAESVVVSTPDDTGRTVKLRPFVRNRALPSRREIAALQEERARMAEEVRTFSQLNGKVSAFENYQSPNYDSNSRPSNSRHRVNRFHKPIQTAVSQPPAVTIAPPPPQEPLPIVEATQSLPTAEPVIKPVANTNQGFSFLHNAEQYFSGLFSHPPDMSASSQTKQAAPLSVIESPPGYPTFPPESPSQSMSNTPMSLSVSPVASAMSEPSGFGSAGPPPFPLSLLPAPALKQLIRSMAYGSTSHAGHAPPSYFGSWHNNSTFNANSPATSVAYLTPQGNFHSYMRSAYSNPRARSKNAPSAVTTSHRKAHTSRNSTKKDQIKLASYPAYSRQLVPASSVSP
jgi:hypothetical protein